MDYLEMYKKAFFLVKEQKGALFVNLLFSLVIFILYAVSVGLASFIHINIDGDSSSAIPAFGILILCCGLLAFFLLLIPVSIFLQSGSAKTAFKSVNGQISEEEKTLKGFVELGKKDFKRSAIAVFILFGINFLVNLPLIILQFITIIPILGTLIYCCGYILYLPVITAGTIFASLFLIDYINNRGKSVNDSVTHIWNLFKANKNEVFKFVIIYFLAIFLLVIFMLTVFFLLVLIVGLASTTETLISFGFAVLGIIFMVFVLLLSPILSMGYYNLFVYFLKSLQDKEI